MGFLYLTQPRTAIEFNFDFQISRDKSNSTCKIFAVRPSEELLFGFPLLIMVKEANTIADNREIKHINLIDDAFPFSSSKQSTFLLFSLVISVASNTCCCIWLFVDFVFNALILKYLKIESLLLVKIMHFSIPLKQWKFAAIQTKEYAENKGKRFTIDSLSIQTLLDSYTLSKIFNCNVRVDKKSLVQCFKAFNLVLEADDYQLPVPHLVKQEAEPTSSIQPTDSN